MITRLISAGIGIVIALIVLFLHNTILLPIAISAIAVSMLYEYLSVNRLLRYHLSAVAALIYAALLPLFRIQTLARHRSMITVLAVTVVFYDYIRHKKRMEDKTVFAFFAGMFLIPTAMSTAVVLNNSHEQHGVAYLVLALGGAWIADSGAYFIGTLFGHAKLCPEISPKKTVAGFFGAIISNVVFFVVFCGIYASVMTSKGVAMSLNWFTIVLIGMVCAVLGTLGDLAASTLKRQIGIKDYGKIMPGHGGMLDRFDSVLLVLPFFTAFVQSTAFFEL